MSAEACPGGLRHQFWELLGSIFEAFLDVFRLFSAPVVRCVFGMLFFVRVVQQFPCFFGSARKRPIGEICNTFRAKTNILKVRSGAGAAGKTKKRLKITCKNTFRKLSQFVDFPCFFVPQGPAAKMASKMTSQSPSGSLPGTLGDPPGAPGRPKTASRRPQEPPGATQDGPRSRPEHPKRALGSSFGDPWRPRGRPEASREPCWRDFGALFEPFSNHSSVPGAHLLGFPGTCF